jgi:hypothetical protein
MRYQPNPEDLDEDGTNPPASFWSRLLAWLRGLWS